MTFALLHKPSPALENCELTFVDREPIHFDKALKQHSHYANALREAGAQVEIVNVNPDSPDAVFVEDVAIVLDELTIITSLGSAPRRSELPAIEKVIARFTETTRISLPATIEGGDVLKVGRTLYIGETSRTNKAGIDALTAIIKPLGYKTVPVKVKGCLHLKTGITALDDETYVLNSAWLDSSPFNGFRLIDVALDEPWGANVLRIYETLIVSAVYPRTADRIESLGYKTQRVDISEFGKAEAGLTCMSLIFENRVFKERGLHA